MRTMETTRKKNPSPTVAGLPVAAPVHAPEELVTLTVKVRRVTGTQNANLLQSQQCVRNGNGSHVPEED